MFSKKDTKNDKIFTVDLTLVVYKMKHLAVVSQQMLCSKRQIHGEDFVNFLDLSRKYELCALEKSFFFKFLCKGKFFRKGTLNTSFSSLRRDQLFTQKVAESKPTSMMCHMIHLSKCISKTLKASPCPFI